MKMHHRSAQNNDPLRELKREVEAMQDSQNKSTNEHMIVLMAALEVGANVDRLVERTGYNKTFIEGIEFRMRKAGLWIGEVVDDREWLDQDLEPLEGIFRHALVAEGSVTRISNMNGSCVYLDAGTGEVSGEWYPKATRT
jgi:hypothetical protein